MLGQTAEQARAGGRRERRFWSWTEDDYVIREVTAFGGPNTEQDGYWWVPELGFSGGEGYHLFATKRLAAQHADRKICQEIVRLERLRANISAD
jgi:hypothetical protein